VSAATAGLAISVYLFGIGVGQLGWGPVSDAIGRRPVLVIGSLIFAAGSLIVAAAPAIGLLLAGRLIQAVGAAATLIATRALVAERRTATADLATLATITLLSPAIAPTLGSLLAWAVGWRGIFVLLATAACLSLAGLRGFDAGEGPAERRIGVTAAYGRLVRSRIFRAFLLAYSLTSAAFYMFLGASPLLLARYYGLGLSQSGLCFFVVAGAIIVGNLLVQRLVARHAERLAPLAAMALLIGAAALGGVAAWPGGTVVPLIGAMAIVGVGSGIATPTILSAALRAEPGLAGTASSIMGATQMLASAGLSALLLQVGTNVHVLLAGIALTVLCAGSALAFASRAERGRAPAALAA
jgi:DHA1 family bicyclomycin/chloramphenicol resistance-like MFS transporter